MDYFKRIVQLNLNCALGRLLQLGSETLLAFRLLPYRSPLFDSLCRKVVHILVIWPCIKNCDACCIRSIATGYNEVAGCVAGHAGERPFPATLPTDLTAHWALQC